MNAPLVERLRMLPPKARAHIFAEVERLLGPGALADIRHDYEGVWLRDHQIVEHVELEAHGLVVFTGPRGDGKTFAAAYLFDRTIRLGKARRPRIFAANEGDIDKAVVHGESGIMSLYSRRDPLRPRWIAAEGPAGVLRYPNGIEVLCFSAKAPEGAVSYNGDLDFYDDVAKWGASAFTAWAHARASCRIGIGCGIVATTRRGTVLLRKLLQGDVSGVLIKRGTDLRANRFNLSSKIYRQLEAELAGTDFLRQELDDEDISASSPFSDLQFDVAPIRILSAPRVDFVELVVAVDPAEGKGGDHDEWGLGVAGRRADGHVVALDDASGSYDDDEAADGALALCDRWGVSKIVVESNRGPRVLNALKAAHYRRERDAALAKAPMPRLPELVPITAKEGKRLRAGPLRVLYLRGMLHHVAGLAKLEKQQREWEPDGPRRPRQDDRIDWLVHAVHYLADLGAIVQHAGPQLDGLAERVRGMQRQREDTRPSPMTGTRPRGPVPMTQRRIL